MTRAPRSLLCLTAAVAALAPACALAQVQPTDAVLALPRDLSPWGMFLNADIVVKVVMLGLVFASVVSWTIWLAKTVELVAARARMQRAIRALADARSLAEVSAAQAQGAAALIAAAETELSLSADAPAADGIKERIASRLERQEAAAARRMIRGTGLLASIGATALGLFAAIPAVVMYNLLSRWTAGYRAQHADASAAVLRLVSRDLDRGALRTAARRAAAE
jgi:biopolymer transport protein ExbB